MDASRDMFVEKFRDHCRFAAQSHRQSASFCSLSNLWGTRSTNFIFGRTIACLPAPTSLPWQVAGAPGEPAGDQIRFPSKRTSRPRIRTARTSAAGRSTDARAAGARASARRCSSARSRAPSLTDPVPPLRPTPLSVSDEHRMASDASETMQQASCLKDRVRPISRLSGYWLGRGFLMRRMRAVRKRTFKASSRKSRTWLW
jgi:hypothetical protein